MGRCKTPRDPRKRSGSPSEVVIADGRARILVGHVLDRLRELPDESVQCAVTSPPYWNLRDYGGEVQIWGGNQNCNHEWVANRYYAEGGGAGSSAEAFSKPGPANAKRIRKARWREDATCRKCGAWRGQLGLEPTPELYVEHLVQILREVRRVLRRDGTLWLVLGDCYYGARGRAGRSAGLKPKDLVMMPARVAIALQSDGWWLRSDIIWHKPNPMPESTRDRPTSAHEHVFLLARSKRYFLDHEAIKEPCADSSRKRISQRTFNIQRGGEKDYGHGVNPNRSARKSLENFAKNFAANGGRRNARDVWNIPTQPFPDAHFAVFPERLVEPCIRAGTSEGGCCPKCGAPRARVLGPKKAAAGRGSGNKRRKLRDERDGLDDHLGASVPWQPTVTETTGWRAACDCDAGDPVPCTVLDPFLGAGTTALVALKLGRAAIGIELNPKYADIARRRIEAELDGSAPGNRRARHA